MKTTGKSESAIAPTTILVLKREPSWSLLRSAQRRRMVRVRMRPKTRSAAVMKLETEYSPITARQLPGLKGTSSEPKVKMAARRRVMAMPPMTSVQRWRGRRLIGEPRRVREISGCAQKFPDEIAKAGTAVPWLSRDVDVPDIDVRRGVVGMPQVSRLHNIGGVWASQGWGGKKGVGVPPPMFSQECASLWRSVGCGERENQECVSD